MNAGTWDETNGGLKGQERTSGTAAIQKRLQAWPGEQPYRQGPLDALAHIGQSGSEQWNQGTFFKKELAFLSLE